MPTQLTRPPAASPPVRHVWTVAEFHRVNSTGVWAGRRPVLLRGVIWEQGPMNPPHATILALALAELQRLFQAGWYVRVQVPLVLSLDTDPVPDLAVVAGKPLDFLAAHPTAAALVVEVSDTTLAQDLTEKAELYAEAGVADYWVLDINARVLHVLRDPRVIAAGGHRYFDARALGVAGHGLTAGRAAVGNSRQ